MHHPTDRIAHTTAFVTPVVEHWLVREIAQWVHPTKDRSNDPSHHERTLLPRSYTSLHLARETCDKHSLAPMCTCELLLGVHSPTYTKVLPFKKSVDRLSLLFQGSAILGFVRQAVQLP